MTTHGYALNVDLDPAPFTDWITACGLEDASFTTMAAELGAGRVDGRASVAAGGREVRALGEVLRPRTLGAAPPTATATRLLGDAEASRHAARPPVD